MTGDERGLGGSVERRDVDRSTYRLKDILLSGAASPLWGGALHSTQAVGCGVKRNGEDG